LHIAVCGGFGVAPYGGKGEARVHGGEELTVPANPHVQIAALRVPASRRGRQQLP
jgi:hypothetical protein